MVQLKLKFSGAQKALLSGAIQLRSDRMDDKPQSQVSFYE